MRLQFLGSAASESIPALWCECENCRKAARLGGRNLRRRTAYLVGDHTLIDFGPDANWQAKEFRLDPSKVERLLVTHSHVDHFSPVELLWRSRNFSAVNRPLRLFCNEAVLRELENRVRSCGMGSGAADVRVEPVPLRPGAPVTDGALEILPIRASHGEGECALNFLLSEAGRNILIANDTGWWPPESWELVRGRKLDAAVIEMSMGIRLPYAFERGKHLGAQAAIAFRDRLAELGAVDSSTRVAMTHISHHVGATHEELEEYFRPCGIEVGYDGLILEGGAQ